jgi:hypothetical protein
MRPWKLFGLLAFGGLISCSPAPEPETATPGAEDVPVEVFLPLGDASRGREAFLELQCHVCHYVDESISPPVSTRPGPDFGPHLANRSRDQLARSIITPSEHNSERNQEFIDGAVSRMGDLTNVMTIRQLMDLVAFLQSL